MKKLWIAMGMVLLMTGAGMLPVQGESSSISYEKSALAAGISDGSNGEGKVDEEKENLILLTWPKDEESVRYEVEIFSGLPSDLDRNTPLYTAIYRNQRIYTNRLLVDRTALGSSGPLYWRVRSINENWEGMGPFSSPRELESTAVQVRRDAPSPQRIQKKRGSLILYPVYSYAGNPGASRYEVEVTDRYPENTEGTAPSKYRVFSKITNLSNLYDDFPRIGIFFWRVRGMDEDGNPVGIWSLPERAGISREETAEVGIFGDSITHGGGHLYHSPADLSYSYLSYLDFNAINMGKSGDTTEMMKKRFDDDVLPFHVKYLLIMGGINDLRMGKDAEEVIRNLENIRKKCEKHHIIPILLTIIPINPDNIKRFYGDVTDEHWREAVDKVNAYIRTKPHIDTAAPFSIFSVMPEEFALDGIHGDWNAKEMIAGEINRHIKEFRNNQRE